MIDMINSVSDDGFIARNALIFIATGQTFIANMI